MTTIVVDGIEYKRAEVGLRHIVVLDRGWIFVGDLLKTGSQWCLMNASNVRKWTAGGFGGLTKDAKGAGAVLDPCADIIFYEAILIVPVAEDWGR